VVATDMVAEKLITPKEAVLLVDPESLNQLLAPGFDPDEWKKIQTVTRPPCGVLAEGQPSDQGRQQCQHRENNGAKRCRHRESGR